MVSATGAAGDSSDNFGVSSRRQSMHLLDFFFSMFNVTNIIIFFFIHTLTHYVITRFLRLPEGFFAICSSYYISGFGAENLKISCQCCSTVGYFK